MTGKGLFIIACLCLGCGAGARQWHLHVTATHQRLASLPSEESAASSPQKDSEPVADENVESLLRALKASEPDGRLRLIVQVLPLLDESGVKSLADFWQSHAEWRSDLFLVELIIGRWAELNSQAALSWALDNEGNEFDQPLTQKALEAMARQDFELSLARSTELGKSPIASVLGLCLHHPEAAFDSLEKNPPKQQNANRLWGDIVHRLQQIDPARTGKLVKSLGLEAAIPELVDHWMLKDPVATLTWLADFADEGQPMRHFQTNKVLHHLCSVDPAQVLTYINSLPKSIFLYEIRSEAAGMLWATSPEFAEQLIDASYPAGKYNNSLIYDVASSLYRTGNLDQALPLIEKYGWEWLPASASGLVTQMFDQGLKHNPEKWKSLANQLPDSDLGKTVRNSLLVAQLRSSPDQALQALKAAPESYAGNAYLLGTEWAQSDLATAAQVVDSFGEAEKTFWYQGMANGLCLNGGIESLAKVAKLPEDQQAAIKPYVWKNLAISHGGFVLAQIASFQDLPNAADILTAAFRNTADRAAQLAVLPQLYRFSQLDQPTVESLHRDVMLSYFNADEHQASQWVRSLPSSPGKDAAIAQMADQLSSKDHRDVEAAMLWARTIRNEATRDKALKQIYDNWTKYDAEAAKSSVSAEAFLSSAAKQEAMKTFNASVDPFLNF